MLDFNKFYLYDIETFPNCFTFSGKFFRQPKVDIFEISTRRNNRTELLTLLSYLQNLGGYMVGFNSLQFDYQVIHDLLLNPYTFDHNKAYQIAMQIINSNRNFFQLVPKDERVIQQIDLFKINHFDNVNKATSLKALQFAMRAESVEDLPFEVGTILTPEQMDILISYNVHDVTETERFLEKNLEHIQMRYDLLTERVLTGDVLNFSDVKIGSRYLENKIGRHKCYSGNKPKQTFREMLDFNEIVLPKIHYRTDDFQEVVEWFKAQKIFVKSDDPLPKLQKHLAGLDFFFGVGGVHASVDSKKFESNQYYKIIDVDVASMYPSIAVANGFYPEHLGQDFVLNYKQIILDRKNYKKGTARNKTLKLSGNGVFGNSDSPFTCFYDPKFPKSITVNGQLQILQLAEMFHLIPGVKLIQANTDGITALVPRDMEFLFNLWCNEWEKMTGLVLEYAEYSKMWIRDVNNYLCLKTNGEVKRKGAYWYPITDEDYDGVWNKDFSRIAVQKATELCLVHGLQPEVAIKLCTDKFDFMNRFKTPGGATTYIGDVKCQRTTRYYISKSGKPMKKIAKPKGELGAYKRKNGITDALYNKVLKEIPPGTWDERIHNKSKTKYEMATTSIESGYLVKECNKASDFDWNDVDYKYYVDEIKKLLIGV